MNEFGVDSAASVFIMINNKGGHATIKGPRNVGLVVGGVSGPVSTCL